MEASCTVTVPSPYILVVPTQPAQPTKPTQPDTPDEPDTPVAPAVNYADVAANDWYCDEVAYVTAKGLMTGTTSTTFAPNATTTRAMVWTILGRMSDAKVDGIRFTVTGLSPISVGWTAPASSGGSSGTSSYTVTVEEAEHGKVTSSHGNAVSGTTVTLTVGIKGIRAGMKRSTIERKIREHKNK